MSVYAGVLLFSQWQMIFRNLTTNEQWNGWRYRYLSRDDSSSDSSHGHGHSHGGHARIRTPFDQGLLGNCLSFFKLRRARRVNATVEMASGGADNVPLQPPRSGHNGGGGEELAPEFDWEGVEQLKEGLIVTPENEAQVANMLRYKMMERMMAQQQNQTPNGHGHAHGAGGHGHSHGGKQCHGHH